MVAYNYTSSKYHLLSMQCRFALAVFVISVEFTYASNTHSQLKIYNKERKCHRTKNRNLWQLSDISSQQLTEYVQIEGLHMLYASTTFQKCVEHHWLLIRVCMLPAHHCRETVRHATWKLLLSTSYWWNNNNHYYNCKDDTQDYPQPPIFLAAVTAITWTLH